MKDLGSMVKLGCILALLAAAACVMLAFVYEGTASIIAERQQINLENSLKELFPDADSFESVSSIESPDPSVTVESAYKVIKNGAPAGAALRLSRASYSGPVKVIVGVNAAGIITGVKIMEHSDTPGLGANAASSTYFVDRANRITFCGQFTGKKTSDAFRVKDDVIAITASTITSAAISAAVKAAGQGAAAWFREGAQ